MIYPNRLTLGGILQGGQTNVATDDRQNSVRLVVFEGYTGMLAANVTASWSLSNPTEVRYLNGSLHVLHDELIPLVSPAPDSTGYMPAIASLHLEIPYSKRITYSGAAANSTSGVTVYLYMISDSGVAPSPGFINGFLMAHFVEER